MDWRKSFRRRRPTAEPGTCDDVTRTCRPGGMRGWEWMWQVSRAFRVDGEVLIVIAARVKRVKQTKVMAHGRR